MLTKSKYRKNADNLKQTSLTKGAIFQTAGKFILEGVAFFTAPIFTRVLSISDYGRVSIYTTWCSLLSLFIGLQVSGSIANAKIEYSEEKLSSYMSSVMSISLASFTLFFALTSAFYKPLARFINIRADLVFLLVVQSFASFCVDFYNSKLIQYKQADKSMYLMTAVSLLSVALSLVFVFTLPCEKYISKIYGSAIPIIGIGIFLCAYVLVKGKVFFNSEYWKFCLQITLPLIFHGAGHLLLGQSDRIMLQKMVGESETGIYSIAVAVSNVMVTIFGSFNNVWVPYYYEYKKKGDVQTILMRSKNYMLNIAMLFASFLLVVPEVFRILVPETYWQTGLKVIPVLTMAAFFRYLYLFPVNHEFYNRNTKLVALGTFLSALINIVLNFIFIKRFSSLGAAAATCVSTVLLFLFHLVIAGRVVKNYEYPPTFYLRGLMIVAITFAVYFLLTDFWLARWGMAVCVGAVLGGRIFKRRSLF